MKHTPGPWKVCQGQTHEWTSVFAENGTFVTNTNHSRARSDGEASANARLIAAAPDLLAALELIANGCEVSSLGDVYPSIILDPRDIARAAIAKATGA